RSDLEGKHVIAIEHLAHALRVLRLGQRHNRLRKHRASTCIDSYEQKPQAAGRENPHQPLLVELLFLLCTLEIHQHTHEQEQHHDAANVENDLHACDERSVKHQVESGLAEQGEN